MVEYLIISDVKHICLLRPFAFRICFNHWHRFPFQKIWNNKVRANTVAERKRDKSEKLESIIRLIPRISYRYSYKYMQRFEPIAVFYGHCGVFLS